MPRRRNQLSKPKQPVAKKSPKSLSPKEYKSLLAIAKKDDGLNKNGSISKTWARKKLKNSRTTESTKAKLTLFLK